MGPMPNHTEFMPDVLDDTAAVCEAIRTRISWIGPVFFGLQLLLQWSSLLKFAAWINPRSHKRRLILLMGAACGLALVSSELFFDGARDSRTALLLLAIFVGFETGAVLLAFELFATPLRLFRDTGE